MSSLRLEDSLCDTENFYENEQSEGVVQLLQAFLLAPQFLDVSAECLTVILNRSVSSGAPHHKVSRDAESDTKGG